MKQGGIAAGVRREETEDSLILTISIPKATPHNSARADPEKN